MPKKIILNIGKCCFTVCKGCYNYFSEDELVSVDTVVHFCQQLEKLYGIKKFTVGGGDPLTRPDIESLLAKLKENGYAITLETVGTPFLREAAIINHGNGTRKMIKIEDVQDSIAVLGISLDGSTNEIGFQIRSGRPNLVTETIELLEKARDTRLKISINTVVHKLNYQDLKNIAKIILSSPNVYRWQLYQYMAIGPVGNFNKKRFSISKEQYDQAITDLLNDDTVKNSQLIIEPGSCDQRKNQYIIVDSAGLVWSPKSTSKSQNWVKDIDANNERIIWGNIKSREKIPDMMDKAMSYLGD